MVLLVVIHHNMEQDIRRSRQEEHLVIHHSLVDRYLFPWLSFKYFLQEFYYSVSISVLMAYM